MSTPIPTNFDPFAHGEIQKTAPATESQREIWTSCQLGPEASLAYNESISIRLRGPLQTEALRLGLQALLVRHESLRGTFSSDGATFCIASPENSSLDYFWVDLSEQAPEQRQNSFERIRSDEVETPF